MSLRGLLNMKSFYIAVNMLLPVCAYVQNNRKALGYNNFDTKEFQSCLQRSRCSQIANTTFEGITCQCDPECTMFGDCCIDAVRTSSKRRLSQACMHFGNITNQGVYMVNGCPINYTGTEEIRRLCQNDDFNDIAKFAPVTDFVNHQIYLNQYCAICNEVPLIFVKAWSISACRVENATIKNFSLTDVIYHPTEKKWGYKLQKRFHLCKFIFKMPSAVPAIGRSCRLDYISSCPISWTGKDFWNACESYIAAVKDSKGILYKNPHCAICNGVSLSDISCLSHAKRNISPTMFQALLDINKAFGANRIYHPRYRPPALLCPEGQRRDGRFGICRTTACAYQGYSIRNGRCVKD